MKPPVLVCREAMPACRDAICLAGCRGVVPGCPAAPPPKPLDVQLCEARLSRHVYRCARCGTLYCFELTCDCGAELTYWGGEPAPITDADLEDWP